MAVTSLTVRRVVQTWRLALLISQPKPTRALWHACLHFRRHVRRDVADVLRLHLFYIVAA